ncbi:hypothetical protein [Zooshikella ganghwensis]|uniref:hypothetical protein n=1 Tax=Zooshikella ganghwensis TaxID=202772 RepID=UPI000407C056|nr:hypothetical protein [Zooshikella ganghwensis]
MARIVPWFQGADVGCYTDCVNENSRDHVLSIINYWRKLALFSGSELDQKILQNGSLQAITLDMLLSSDFKLPWLLKEQCLHQSQRGYTLLLLPYEKSYLFNKVSEIFSCADTSLDRFIRREHGMFDGINCYASCQLTGNGQLASPYLQVSTQPWACGQLRSILVNEFQWDAFEKADQDLLDGLSTWYDQASGVLDNTHLLSLVRLLQQWAGVAPTGKYVVYLVPKVQLPRLSRAYAFSSTNKPISIAYDPQLATLTEIYTHVRKRYNHQPFLDYFGQVDSAPYSAVRLEEKAGNEHTEVLGEILRNRARGLRKSSHIDDPALQPILTRVLDGKLKENLFCISSVINTEGFSLWQDTVADILVRKAKVLSEFASARNTITHTKQVVFNGQTYSIAGFDRRILSNHTLMTANLPSSDEVKLHWLKQLLPGKISRENGVGELLEFYGIKGISASELLVGAAELGYDLEAVDSFKTSKINFLQKNSECQSLSHNIHSLFKLYEKLGQETLHYETKNNNDLSQKQEQYQSVVKSLQQITKELEESFSYIRWLKQQLIITEQQAPSYLSRIYNPKAWKDYRDKLDELQQQLLNCEKQTTELEKQKRLVQLRYDALAPEMSKINIKLETQKLQKKKLKEDYIALFAALAGCELDCNLEVLPDPRDIQESLCQQYNTKQTALYLAALQLHAAWINELVEHELVANNLLLINAIKKGYAEEIQPEVFTAVWQLLGVLNPVLVTPHNNIDSLLLYLRRGEIDWLLVNHGESFSPAVAASAIWCSRSIVLLGNPFEATPMQAIPAELHHVLGLNAVGADYVCWSPQSVSAYSIANRYSRENKQVVYKNDSDEYCLSMPLQHVGYFLEELQCFWRESLPSWFKLQCLSQSEKAKPFGQSMWIHLEDHFDERKCFALQQKLVLQFVVAHYLEEQQLPDMYIVCQGQNEVEILQKWIAEPLLWHQYLSRQEINLSTEKLDEWAKQYICSLQTAHQCQSEFLVLLIPINGLFEDWLQEYPNFLLSLVGQTSQAIYFLGPHHLAEKNDQLCLLQQQLAVRKLPPAFYDEVLDDYPHEAKQMA